ncbi:hypothetical protein ABIE50_004783 [Chitinophaga sp. OAE865]
MLLRLKYVLVAAYRNKKEIIQTMLKYQPKSLYCIPRKRQVRLSEGKRFINNLL